MCLFLVRKNAKFLLNLTKCVVFLHLTNVKSLFTRGGPGRVAGGGVAHKIPLPWKVVFTKSLSWWCRWYGLKRKYKSFGQNPQFFSEQKTKMQIHPFCSTYDKLSYYFSPYKKCNFVSIRWEKLSRLTLTLNLVFLVKKSAIFW